MKVRRNIRESHLSFPPIALRYSARILSSNSFLVDFTSFSKSRKTTLISSFSERKESAIVLATPATMGASAAIISYPALIQNGAELLSVKLRTPPSWMNVRWFCRSNPATLYRYRYLSASTPFFHGLGA